MAPFSQMFEPPQNPGRFRFFGELGDSAGFQQLLAQRNNHPGFYERLYRSVDTRCLCPWLANGLYLTTQGDMVACCHIKDYQRYRLGVVEHSNLSLVRRRRRAMQGVLSSGRLLKACQGCPVAHTILRNIAGLPSRSPRGNG